MALQVWLPLNRDLHNQGLSNFTITNNGATIDDNGKIGKCYSFNSNYIKITDLSIPINTWSLTAWAYPQADTSSGHQYIVGINTSSASDFLGVLCFYQNKFGIRTAGTTYSSPNTSALNHWYHICATYDGTDLKLYVNGILVLTKNSPAAPKAASTCYIGTRGGITGNFHGKINDVRIYDHCLSDKEVEEISKGLVLHYQLNNNGLGGNNLLTGTNDFSEWYLNSRWSKNGKIATYSAGSKAWNDMDSPTISWSEVQGKTLTISAELRSDDFNYTDGSGFSICFVRKASGPAATGYSTRRLECTPIHLTKNQITTKWKKYSSTILNISDSSFTNTYNGGGGDWFGIYIWNYTNKSVQIKNIKLEIGNIATNYSPAPIDIGMNSNIIYDSSGYNNNGEIINTLSTEIPSPKNNISLHFSATNQKIKISGLSTTGFSNSYSFAWWEKINSVAPMHWGFSDGVRLNGMYTGRLWNTGDGSNNPLYNPGTTTQVAAPSVNIWHHWVMTGDGTKCRVYQDGILWAEAKTYKTITGTTIYINGWDTNTNYSSDNASISDFRIYATALTADQIKELYETSKIIDGTTVKARDLEASI